MLQSGCSWEVKAIFGIREDYALRALIDLAARGKERPVQSRDIAQRGRIPPAYLDQILLQLRRGGIVQSVRGAAGGFLLARPADEITVADVLRALRGDTAVFRAPDLPPEERPVALAELWERLQSQADAVLEGTTLHDLAERQEAAERERAPMFYI